MPFYEYQCATCGHRHEELQKVDDRPLRKCPGCGRSTLRRLVSAPVFRLKGGGWYETDFKADKETQRNLAGDKEPVAETPKEVKDGAVAKDAAPKPADAAGKTAEPASSAAGPKADAARTARKTAARRRTRK